MSRLSYCRSLCLSCFRQKFRVLMLRVMTRSYDSPICIPRLIHVTHLCVCHDAFIHVTHLCVCHDAFSHVTHLCVCHDACIHVTHLCVCHDAFSHVTHLCVCHDAFSHVTHLCVCHDTFIHVTHLCVCHDTFIHVTHLCVWHSFMWLIYVCATHSCDSFMCVPWRIQVLKFSRFVFAGGKQRNTYTRYELMTSICLVYGWHPVVLSICLMYVLWRIPLETTCDLFISRDINGWHTLEIWMDNMNDIWMDDMEISKSAVFSQGMHHIHTWNKEKHTRDMNGWRTLEIWRRWTSRQSSPKQCIICIHKTKKYIHEIQGGEDS